MPTTKFFPENSGIISIMKRNVTKLVVHCTASPDNLDIGAREINEWHVTRGWSGIGYHWVIRRDGTIEAGRPEESSGAHVKGHNHDSIGIVWVGTDNIEDEQMDALRTKVKELCYRYKLNKEDVYGHYEFDSGKTCPNLKMDDFRNSLIGRSQKKETTSQADLLPDGPSEDDIETSLEELENSILDEDML